MHIFIRSRNKEIYYFKDKGECDFVVMNKGKIKECVQVCYQLNDVNLTREIDGLIAAIVFFDQLEGIIVTLDQDYRLEKHGKVIHVVAAHRYLSAIVFDELPLSHHVNSKQKTTNH